MLEPLSEALAHLSTGAELRPPEILLRLALDLLDAHGGLFYDGERVYWRIGESVGESGQIPGASALHRVGIGAPTSLSSEQLALGGLPTELGPARAVAVTFESGAVGVLAIVETGDGSVTSESLVAAAACVGRLYDFEQGRSRPERLRLRLERLLEASLALNAVLALDELLERLMDIAIELTEADAGSLLLKNRQTGNLEFRIARGEDGDSLGQQNLAPGEGIAGWVAKHGEIVRVTSARDDPRFSGRIDQSLGRNTDTILCVPLQTRDELIGSVEVLRFHPSEPFSSDLEVVLSSLASHAAVAIRNAQLYELAITDELTGLYSYRYFQEALGREIKLAERRASTLSVIIIDIDHFKKFNDQHGHETGDQVLRAIAESLRSSLRATDVCARYGGEEFVIAMRDMRKNTAMVVAERIRLAAAELILSSGSTPLHVTVSVGVATFPSDTSVASDLFYLADAALYEAKGQGRNRVAGAVPAADT